MMSFNNKTNHKEIQNEYENSDIGAAELATKFQDLTMSPVRKSFTINLPLEALTQSGYSNVIEIEPFLKDMASQLMNRSPGSETLADFPEFSNFSMPERMSTEEVPFQVARNPFEENYTFEEQIMSLEPEIPMLDDGEEF